MQTAQHWLNSSCITLTPRHTLPTINRVQSTIILWEMKKHFKRTVSSHVATMYLRQVDSPSSKDSNSNQQAVLQQLVSLSFQEHQKISILQYLSKVLVALFPAIIKYQLSKLDRLSYINLIVNITYNITSHRNSLLNSIAI